jgi:hypothetical protein
LTLSYRIHDYQNFSLYDIRSVQILSAIPSFKQLSKSLCDDWVDRLNHVYTVYLLVLFAVLVSSMQYVGAPIYCWVPAELHMISYKNYIHNYCWVKNTYYIPFFEALPKNVNEREVRPCSCFAYACAYVTKSS